MSDPRLRQPAPSLSPCVTRADLFTQPLLEEPPRSDADHAERRRYEGLLREATAVCASCPLQVSCLYTAVVDYDVAGVVAGTTQRQRRAIRRRLRIRVDAEDLDSLAGVAGSNHRVDHEEVVRLRLSHPHETLDQLAARLGCSTSTVKRHLRRDRLEITDTDDGLCPPATVDQVLAAARQVTNRPGPSVRPALVA